jgi:copper chaperone NosL
MPRSAPAFLLALVACAPSASGPVPIVWDREACAHCHMLIGDPAFAAQLQTPAGQVASFDDPGCLLTYLQERRVEGATLWFHHHTEDRWLSANDVVFVPRTSPMGYGFGAARAGTPEGRSLADVTDQIASRR